MYIALMTLFTLGILAVAWMFSEKETTIVSNFLATSPTAWGWSANVLYIGTTPKEPEGPPPKKGTLEHKA